MMIKSPILRVVTKLLIPYILLFALYVQFHGDFGPGGGFQAGVIFASAFILYALVFGLQSTKRVAQPELIEVLISLGVLIFGFTGVVTILAGGNYLQYDVLDHRIARGILPHGEHLGMFLIELGVGITVASVMIAIFYSFAGRERSQ
jgi:multicomponent Na+:H+ antiporter subunit B